MEYVAIDPVEPESQMEKPNLSMLNQRRQILPKPTLHENPAPPETDTISKCSIKRLLNKKKKKFTATSTRLTTSLSHTKELLKTSKEKIGILKSYQEEKLKVLQRTLDQRSDYNKQKLALLKEKNDLLRNILSTLNPHLENISEHLQ